MLSYRHNAREEVLRARYENAKRTLEKIAEDDNFHEYHSYYNAKFGDALATMGFERQSLRRKRAQKYPSSPLMITLMMDHPVSSPIDEEIVYIRERDGMTEILAEHALDGKNGALSLYRIPVKQDIETWYGSIPERVEKSKVYTSKRKKAAPFASQAAGMSALLGCIVTVPFVNDLDHFWNVAIGSLFIVAPITITLGTFCYLMCRLNNEHLLQKELAASGPKALEYIAGTPFEDVLRHDTAPILPIQVRVEEPQDYAERAREEAEAVVKNTIGVKTSTMD